LRSTQVAQAGPPERVARRAVCIRVVKAKRALGQSREPSDNPNGVGEREARWVSPEWGVGESWVSCVRVVGESWVSSSDGRARPL
jgi:hypothetical protein